MKKQKGATLITILILLLIIIIIGTLAIRKSLTSLSLATAAQAQQLMMQSSDAALKEFESPQKIAKRLTTGVFAHLDSTQQIYCYTGQQDPFLNQQTCSATSFASTRDAVITQVYIEKVKQDIVSDTDYSTVKLDQNKPINIKVTVISTIPALSRGNPITCLSNNNKDQAIACLQQGSDQTPYYISIGQYLFGAQPEEAS